MRRQAIEKILCFFIVDLITALLLGFPFGWILMIGVGGLHSWTSPIPAMGFWTAYWVSVAFLTIVSALQGRPTSEESE